MSRYTDYKQSGIEWIGEVPEHWDVVRLKAVIESSQNGIWGDEEQGDENDVVCVRVADFDMDALGVSDADLTVRNVAQRFQGGRLLHPGDLIIEKSGGGEKQLVGRVVRFDLPHKSVCSNFVARVTPRQEAVDSTFLLYYFQHLYNGRVNYRSVKQTTGIQNLDADAYFDERICRPPLEEQQEIARYLDRKTGEIDTLIRKKQQLINLLREQRTGLINRAVTKGLDPDVPMKDSGIEWLGEVPEHWMMTRLKHVLDEVGTGGTPSTSKEEYWADDGGIPWVAISDMTAQSLIRSTAKCVTEEGKEAARLQVLPKGTLLISIFASLGKTSVLGVDAAVNQAILGLVPSEVLDRDFLQYYLRVLEGYISYYSSSNTQENLNLTKVRNLDIPAPSVEEQRGLVDYLDRTTGEIDSVVAREQDLIEMLTELRTSLISEVVTGKIDVRDEVSAPVEDSAEGVPA